MKRNLELEEDIKQWYKRRMKEDLNIEEPQTFNEKIQWLKLYDSTPLKGKLADKYESREWLKNELGQDYSIPIIGVWDKFDDIDFDKLPNKFVLKATHGSSWNIIVKDKSKLDKTDAKQKFDKWLATDFGSISREYHYRYIKPRIIAEEFIDFEDGLMDYRVYCFNGVPKEVWVDKYSGTPYHQRTIYDLDWNKKDFLCTWPPIKEDVNKPKNLDLMIDIAKKVSKYFVFVRVDFYEVNGKLYLGEITFTPMAGLCDYKPKEYEKVAGDMIDLSPVMKNYEDMYRNN